MTETEANLLARTRLRAPIKVGSGPSVEAMMRVDGKPRQIVASTLCLDVRRDHRPRADDGTANDHGFRRETANQVGDADAEIVAVSFKAVRAGPSLLNARSISAPKSVLAAPFRPPDKFL